MRDPDLRQIYFIGKYFLSYNLDCTEVSQLFDQALKLITIILGFAKMDQRKTPIPNLEFVKIINVTNKHCHMCCKEFSSVSELHVHINNDHDFRHPCEYLIAKHIVNYYEIWYSPSNEDLGQCVSISAMLKRIQDQQEPKDKKPKI